MDSVFLLLFKHNIGFICDEVQTGVAVSGRWWAHEYWNLENPPDIVTFAKKMSTGGFYFTNDLKWKHVSLTYLCLNLVVCLLLYQYL